MAPRPRPGTPEFEAAIGRAFLRMFFFIPILYVIELVDVAVGGRLDHGGGIRPRSLFGVDGVVFAPFLHANFTHLAANSVTLILLGSLVLAGQTRKFFAITALIMVFSGVGTWLLGEAGSVVVGASGVIFGYLGYLLLRGIVERSLWDLAMGAVVGLVYGWQLVGVLPSDPRVSWQAHMFGFIGGLVAAVVFRQRSAPPEPVDGLTQPLTPPDPPPAA